MKVFHRLLNYLNKTLIRALDESRNQTASMSKTLRERAEPSTVSPLSAKRLFSHFICPQLIFHWSDATLASPSCLFHVSSVTPSLFPPSLATGSSLTRA